MASKLLIIQPSFYRSPGKRVPVRVHHRQLVPLVLPYLAALTPKGWDITLVDEMVRPVDFAAPADVVAIHRNFYSLPSLFCRLPLPINTSAVASWVLNVSQRRVSAYADGELNFTSY
jgi:hypothetical protein